MLKKRIITTLTLQNGVLLEQEILNQIIDIL